MKKIESIYGLKGFGAFLIIIYHYTSRYKNLYNCTFEVPIIFNYFHYGVEIFLILSGIGVVISYKNSKSFNEFLLKKLKKLYIPYFLVITLIFVTLQSFLLEDRRVNLKDYIGNIFLLQDFEFKYVDGAHWTLILVIRFYIIISILKFYKIEKFKILPLFTLLTISPIILSINQIFFKILGYILFLKYLGLFVAGIALINILEKYKSTQMKYLYFYSFFITCLNYKITEYKNNYFCIVMIYILIYISVIFPNKFKIFRSKILIGLGIISFEIYLIHQNLGYILLNIFIKIGLNIYISIFIVCLIIGITSYLFWKINNKIYKYIRRIEMRKIYEAKK